MVKFSDTAIEALRKESEHLYNNTYVIVAHAIGFSRKDIQSDKSFKETLIPYLDNLIFSVNKLNEQLVQSGKGTSNILDDLFKGKDG